MAGRRRDQRTSPLDFWNPGKRTGGQPAVANGLRAQKFSPGQAAQHRLLELSSGTPRSLLSAVNVIAKHFRHDAIAAEKVDLEPVRLLLRTRFRVDAADIFF